MDPKYDPIYNRYGQFEDPLLKREQFAISLRQNKKKAILAKKRTMLFSKSKQSTSAQLVQSQLAKSKLLASRSCNALINKLSEEFSPDRHYLQRLNSAINQVNNLLDDQPAVDQLPENDAKVIDLTDIISEIRQALSDHNRESQTALERDFLAIFESQEGMQALSSMQGTVNACIEFVESNISDPVRLDKALDTFAVLAREWTGIMINLPYFFGDDLNQGWLCGDQLQLHRFLVYAFSFTAKVKMQWLQINPSVTSINGEGCDYLMQHFLWALTNIIGCQTNNNQFLISLIQDEKLLYEVVQISSDKTGQNQSYDFELLGQIIFLQETVAEQLAESIDTEVGYMTDLLAFFEFTQTIMQNLYSERKIYGTKDVYSSALTWIKSVVHFMQTNTTRQMIYENIDLEFLLQLLKEQDSEEHCLSCQEQILEILSRLFQLEAIGPIMMLAKLDFVDQLSQINPKLLSKIEFAILLNNMIVLEKPQLQSIGDDFFLKLCESNITEETSLTCLTMHKPIEFQVEGVVFFSKFISMLHKLSEIPSHETFVELQLSKVVHQWDMFGKLKDCVFTQSSSFPAAELFMASEIVQHTIKLADGLQQDSIAKVFEQSECLDAIENLQNHENDQVREQIEQLIDWYSGLSQNWDQTANQQTQITGLGQEDGPAGQMDSFSFKI